MNILEPKTVLEENDIKQALKYIDDYWPTLIKETPEDKRTQIGLPNPFVIPSIESDSFKFNEQYYWDSYFTAIGLTDKKYQPLVEGMLDNLIFLFKRFGLIPNASRMYMLSRSQPPILTSYIFLVYERYGKTYKWLKEYMSVAEEEYKTVWMNNEHPNWRQVYKGLSRYYDINVLHDLAEAESGWDMTTRFDRKCLDYLPIDLNCLLYKYESDFARAAAIANDRHAMIAWEEAAAQRKSTINSMLWGKMRGFYFDFDYQRRSLGTVWSLAGYYALWAGVAEDKYVPRMIENLKKFEHKGGLSTTAKPIIDLTIFGSLKAQWAYPNGWAPLHYIVVKGLERYGFQSDAERIRDKWLITTTEWFKRHGEFIEKYNVVHPKQLPVEGVYPSQRGFGWTNAIYQVFAEDKLGTTSK